MKPAPPVMMKQDTSGTTPDADVGGLPFPLPRQPVVEIHAWRPAELLSNPRDIGERMPLIAAPLRFAANHGRTPSECFKQLENVPDARRLAAANVEDAAGFGANREHGCLNAVG